MSFVFQRTMCIELGIITNERAVLDVPEQDIINTIEELVNYQITYIQYNGMSKSYNITLERTLAPNNQNIIDAIKRWEAENKN